MKRVEKFPFVEACRAIRKAGYEGIEIAPIHPGGGSSDYSAL